MLFQTGNQHDSSRLLINDYSPQTRSHQTSLEEFPNSKLVHTAALRPISKQTGNELVRHIDAVTSHMLTSNCVPNSSQLVFTLETLSY